MSTFIKAGLWIKKKEGFKGELDLDYLISQQSVPGSQGPTGPQGVPGLQGIPGTAGAVGPAGLNWQGTWVSGTSYVADDAVGYGGASWFCILATSGTTNPSVTPLNWALLASQGAQGIQGIQGLAGATGAQGPSGSAAAQTYGIMYLASGDSPRQTLGYDINRINLSSTSAVNLPANAPVGKEISVFVETSTFFLSIFGDNVLNLSFPFLMGSANQQTATFPIFGSESYVFISLGNGLWKVNAISKTIMTGSAATSISTRTLINATNVSVLDANTSLGNSLFKDSLRFIRDNGSGTNKTLNLLVPTNIVDNRTITLPDATGTVALQTYKECAFKLSQSGINAPTGYNYFINEISVGSSPADPLFRTTYFNYVSPGVYEIGWIWLTGSASQISAPKLDFSVSSGRINVAAETNFAQGPFSGYKFTINVRNVAGGLVDDALGFVNAYFRLFN